MMDGVPDSYPFLNVLLPILRRYDSKITEADICNPETNNFLGILCAILEHLGMHPQMILDPQPHASVLLASNVVPYTSSVKQLNIYCIVKNILAQFDIHDFSYNDICRPRQQRMLDILGILTNVIQLKEEHEGIFCSKIKEIIAFEEKIQALEQEHKYLEQTIPLKIPQIDAQKEHNTLMLNEISDKETQLSLFKPTIENQSKTLEVLKKDVTELTSKLKNAKNVNMELQNDIALLKNNIVQSPQKIIEEAEDCQNNLNFLCKQHSELKQKLNETLSEKSCIEKSLEKIQSCLSFPLSLTQEIERSNEVNVKLHTLQELNMELTNTIQQENFNLQLHTEQLAIKLKATQQLEVNVERKRDEVKKKLEYLQTTKEANIAEIKELQNTLKQMDEKRVALTKELSGLDINSDDDQQRYNSLCQVLTSIQGLETAVQ